MALLGANGAGKSTTLKAISGLLKTEDGEVTRGEIMFNGERINGIDPDKIVRRGIFQVMEGRRIIADMTSLENLRLGAFTRSDNEVAADIDMVYNYFPRLKERTGLAGYLSGGEQQMLAIGRALMARPKMILMDEPSMGLSPLLVKEVFAIIQEINRDLGVTILLVEQNARAALVGRKPRLHHGAGQGRARRHRRRIARQRGRQGILSRRRRRPAQELQEPEKLQAAEAMAVRRISPPSFRGTRSEQPRCAIAHRETRHRIWSFGPSRNDVRNGEDAMTDHYDALETRDPSMREAELFSRLPDILRKAMEAPGYAERLRGIDPAAITSRSALATLPVLRKSDLPALHKATPPFGGFVGKPPGAFARLYTSPGPIFEPEATHADPWRGARALFAAGFRDGDVVLNTFSYHLTPGGFIFDTSARALGCAVIPAGPGNTEAQFELIEAYRPVGYCGTPDFLKILLDARPPPTATSPRSSARWFRARRFRLRCRRRSSRTASTPIRRSAPPISA